MNQPSLGSEGFRFPSQQNPSLVIAMIPALIAGAHKCVLNEQTCGFQNCQGTIGSPLLQPLDSKVSTSREKP